MNDPGEIKELEEELRLAMIAGDVARLDALISNDLIFTDHTGTVLTKEMDLDVHRSGNLKINSLHPREQKIRLHGDTAVVSVLMDIEGVYLQQAFIACNRYTRIWARKHGKWMIIAVHSGSSVAPERTG